MKRLAGRLAEPHQQRDLGLDGPQNLVAAVVGAHFFPLVRVLREPSLRLLGAVVCAVAPAGLIAGLATSLPAGLVAGTGAGLALLGYAVMALAAAVRRG